MMNPHDTQYSAKPATAKRKSQTKLLMIAAASLALSAVALPAAAAQWWDATPNISIGSRTINVKNMGAKGNGSHDDTAAIQAAVNALPSSGGTVYVPAGRYMINAVKSISLRSHTRLLMDANATLQVIPNGQSRYEVIKVVKASNVRIQGGNLVGDRSRHKGSTGEWGYGIQILGAKNVLVQNVKISNFWGDGMWIGGIGHGGSLVRADYVTVNGVVSSNNRRQGLSIGPSQHVYIVNSTFKDTHGTKPEAGIDIEPGSQGPVNTIRLERNTFSGNKGNGIELHANISNINITNNTLTNNYGFGVLAVAGGPFDLGSNHATRNGLAGVGMSGSAHNAYIHNNTLQYNSTRFVSATRAGGSTTRDIQIGKNTRSITQSANKLTPSR
jgi:parallel beta-helix repeat protein